MILFLIVFFLSVPCLIYVFLDCRKNIGRLKFYLAVLAVAIVICLIIAFFSSDFYSVIFAFNMLGIASYLSFQRIADDYGHIYLFGKRQQENKEKK